MNRIPGVSADLSSPLAQLIRARRGGTLLNLDRVLLNSEPLARGWNDYLKLIRTGLSIPPLLREIAICGVAALTGAEYEFSHHEPEFLRAGGSPIAARLLRSLDTAAAHTEVFDSAARAVIKLTVQMTRNIKVDSATWACVVAELPSRQAQVEIVAIIATYNMVSRFLVACEVPLE